MVQMENIVNKKGNHYAGVKKVKKRSSEYPKHVIRDMDERENSRNKRKLCCSTD